jgi:hypothetical protein
MASRELRHAIGVGKRLGFVVREAELPKRTDVS